MKGLYFLMMKKIEDENYKKYVNSIIKRDKDNFCSLSEIIKIVILFMKNCLR